jgi:hypothetical protein
MPAPKTAMTIAATSCARATSQGGATRPARAIAASVAARMSSDAFGLKSWTPGRRATCGGDWSSCEAGDDLVGAALEGTISKSGAIMASSDSVVARAREARGPRVSPSCAASCGHMVCPGDGPVRQSR